MKYSFFLLFAIFATGCQDDDDNSPRTESSWELAFVLADPGDGSGTFQPVDSDLALDLLADGTYTANGDICSFSTNTSGTNTTGDYSIINNTISPENCVTTGGNPIRLEERGDTLDITYLCIEACAHRYLRR